MLDKPIEPRTIAPLISVIIPLEFHRGQWERCWQGWQSQTLDRTAFEIILVVPPNFPDPDKLSELRDPIPLLEYSQHSHDIALSADGAASARGEFLFFTESHCWPEPDVLELCLQAFRINADWAAFSCKSIPITHNRLSEAEADMYDVDIEYGMKNHPWRKILDQCFVTRREAYHECGGLKPEFGHFSEWVLAANYFECGLKIGYLPEARIHHYYIGTLPELKTFTLDFVKGEIRYFSQERREPRSHLLEPPSELICQDNYAPDMAREILRMAVQDILTSGAAYRRWRQAVFAIARWAIPAMFGDGIARGAAAAVTLHARLAVMLALLGSRERLGARLKLYIAALVRLQRLHCIRTERLSRAAVGTPDAMIGSGRNAVLDRTGFYPLEKYRGFQFRWSEPAAAVRVRADASRQSVLIKCAPNIRNPSEMDLRFYFDGERISDDAISMDLDDFEIRIDLPKSGTCKLGWLCRHLKATKHPRRLGLPVMRVELAS